MATESKNTAPHHPSKLAELKAKFSEEKTKVLAEIKEEFAELLHRLSNLTHGLDAEEKKELLTHEKHKPSLEVLGFELAGFDPSPVFVPTIVSAPKRGRKPGKVAPAAKKAISKAVKGLSQSDIVITAINDGKVHHVKDILSKIHKEFDSKFKMQSLRVVLSKLVKLKAIKGLGNGKYKLKG